MAQLQDFVSVTIEPLRQPTNTQQQTSDNKAIERIELAPGKLTNQLSLQRIKVLNITLKNNLDVKVLWNKI